MVFINVKKIEWAKGLHQMANYVDSIDDNI